MTVRFPRSAFGWKALGATLRQLGRSEDALSPAQMAVTLHKLLHAPLLVLSLAHVIPAMYLAFQRRGWIRS